MESGTDTWVLACSDRERLRELSRAHTGYAFAGAATGGQALMRLVRAHAPALVVADMVLPEYDGLALIARIREALPAHLPYLVLLSNPLLACVNERALRSGASCVLTQGINALSLERATAHLSQERRLHPSVPCPDAVRETLWRLGFSPRHKGTRYLYQAILYCARDRKYLESLMTGLYPAIARQNNTSASNVSHAIRRAIEAAWSSGSIKQQYAFFGNTIDEGRAKPTALAMIARVAEQVRVKQGKGDDYAY